MYVRRKVEKADDIWLYSGMEALIRSHNNILLLLARGSLMDELLSTHIAHCDVYLRIFLFLPN